MILLTINHTFKYELEKLCLVFFSAEKIKVYSEPQTGDRVVLTQLVKGENETRLLVDVSFNGVNKSEYSTLKNDLPDYDAECERNLSVLIFKCLSTITGYVPKWGILTGVRPAKLMSRIINKLGTEGAKLYFKEKFLVSEDKINLCLSALSGEEAIIGLSVPESFSLYVSIPFCPSRCTYCSFVSNSVERAAKLVPQYVDLLCEELIFSGKIAKECGIKLETVYIGGGTPTTLSAAQLSHLMKVIADNFNLNKIREYTVEAGRPDTVTLEKLRVIKSGGATRISINPQTMNDEVLQRIGRRHTTVQTKEAMQMAREIGFNNINMDLIAGLPGDSLDSFEKTVNEVLNLNPESVTIHTLSMKKSSTLTEEGRFPALEAGKIAGKMLEIGKRKLQESGIFPYYMYRQGKTVGNLENVGYAKSGFEGLYNVYIMDETHTILAAGASAVTKLKDPLSSNIERIFNFKYPYEYISRFDEILHRKNRVKEFYNEIYCSRNK